MTQEIPKPSLELYIVRAFTVCLFFFPVCLCVRDIWLLASCGHNTTVLWVLALRKVLKDKAEVSQAVFEGGQRQDSRLIGRVQLEYWQQPPAPRWTVGWGLKEVNEVRVEANSVGQSQMQ